MSERYEVFVGSIDANSAAIGQGEEVTIVAKDLENFGKVGLRCKISKSEGDLDSPDVLRIVTDMGEKSDQMFIQVIEEVDTVQSVDSA